MTRSWFFLSILFAAGSVANAVEPLPRWKFQPGARLRFEIQQAIDTQSVPAEDEQPVDPPPTQTLTFAWTFDWQINEVQNGVARGPLIIRQLSGKLASAERTLQEFGSDQDGGATSAAAALVGRELTLALDERGEIVAVDPSESLVRAVQPLPAAWRVEELLTRDGLRNLLRLLAPPLPKKRPSQLAPWRLIRRAHTPLGSISTVWTLTHRGSKPVQGRELLEYQLTGEATFEGSKLSPLGPATRLFEPKLSGSLFFDEKDGRLVGSNSEQEFVLATQLPAGETRQQIRTVNRLLVTILE